MNRNRATYRLVIMVNIKCYDYDSAEKLWFDLAPFKKKSGWYLVNVVRRGSVRCRLLVTARCFDIMNSIMKYKDSLEFVSGVIWIYY